jgi:acetyl-CoA carboxylase biotin carboxyl carrier protein
LNLGNYATVPELPEFGGFAPASAILLRLVCMNLKELKEIIDLVTSKESIEELELEKSGVRLRIRRASNHTASAAVASAAITSAVPAAALPQGQPEIVEQKGEELYYIKSPIVGTFFKAPSPNSEAFVSVGDFVEKGSVVCIVEAMKLINEIESDVAGEIISILVENGQPVEYGERLFAIRPR